MRTRRMIEQDVQHVDDALERLTEARESVKAIDLRQYGGDGEMREALKAVRVCLDESVKTLRHVKALKWRL